MIEDPHTLFEKINSFLVGVGFECKDVPAYPRVHFYYEVNSKVRIFYNPVEVYFTINDEEQHETLTGDDLTIVNISQLLLNFGIKIKTVKMTLIFIWNEGVNKVLLIEKSHPEWQRGYYNGIGGKLNEEEINNADFKACAVREIKEETDLDVTQDRLILIGTLEDSTGAEVSLYSLKLKQEEEVLAKTMTEEPIDWFHFIFLPRAMICNLEFLIPYSRHILTDSIDTSKTFLKLFYTYK